MALKVLLWIAAGLCLLGLVPLLAPEWLSRAGLAGIGFALPADERLCVYLVRVTGGSLAALGFFLVRLAQHPARYGRMVALAGLVLVFLGAVGLGAGLALGVWNRPLLGGALAPLALGVLILLASRTARRREH